MSPTSSSERDPGHWLPSLPVGRRMLESPETQLELQPLPLVNIGVKAHLDDHGWTLVTCAREEQRSTADVHSALGDRSDGGASRHIGSDVL